MAKDHYQILGVPRDASTDAIVAAHAERQRQFSAHPEVGRMLDEALATLGEPSARQRYDQSLRAPPMEPPLVYSAAPEHSFRSERRRPRGATLLILSALAVIIVSLWQVRRTSPKPAQAKPAAPLQQSQSTREAPPDTAGTAKPIETYTPILPPTAAVPAGNAAPASLSRPAKKPGFDAAHLAWSVYVVIGAKSRGSGVMLEKGKLLTNCHVISGSYQPRSVVVINSATREAFYPEKVANLNEPDDICLLEVPGAPEYLAEWGDSRSLPEGAVTHTISFPGNLGLTQTTGQLVRRESIKGLSFLMTSNPCSPGVSGGPLFDAEGRVVGITTGGRRYQLRSGEIIQGECISVESETAREVMWRVMVPIAFGPFNYQGALGGGK